MNVTTLEEEKASAVSGPSAARRRARWPWLLGLGALALLAYFYLSPKSKSGSDQVSRTQQRPVPVVVAEAKKGDIPVYLRGLGSVTPLKTATIRSRVDGQLMSVSFREGQNVQEGEVLVQIDPRPFDVQLQQAEGQLAKDQAAIRDAQINLDRFKSLFDQQILSQQQLDSQKAIVDQLNGSISSDTAQIENANLQLTYAKITAPFGGRVGLRLVDPGNIVHANDTNGLLVLTQVHPITVVFSLPQDDLTQVMARQKAAGDAMAAEAWDRDNEKKIAQGKLLSIDNEIDPTTGTYKLKAIFDNADDALFPNQFVNVRLLIDTKRGLVVAPSAALQRGPDGAFVYVVNGDKASIRKVVIGITEGQDLGITSGLNPGESVIVDGMDKLQEGTPIDLGTRRASPQKTR